MRLYEDKPQEREAATYENTRRTGFSENWHHTLGLTMTEDLPIISRVIPSETQSARDRKISDYRKQELIPEKVVSWYGSDSDGLAHYARTRLGLDDIPTQAEYEKQKLEEYVGYRELTGQITSQAGVMGKIGQLTGTMHAMALDPIYASSFLTGYGGAATAGQAFIRVGVMEAGIEALAQPFKMAWKEEIGADYSGAQALTEIIFAGVGAGTLAGIGKGLGRALTPRDLKVKDAIPFVESVAKRNPEMRPIAQVLSQSGPEENLAKVLSRDEAIDINKANQGPTKIEEPEIEFKVDEENFYKRTSEELDEGVQRHTPLKDLNEEDALVYKTDENLKTIEDCSV